MKKFLKGIFFILLVATFLGAILYLSKENPRRYLNNRVNILYVNENIDSKDFNDTLVLLEEAGVTEINDFKEIQKWVKGLYIISNSDFTARHKKFVGILDVGYKYPLITLKLENYFTKAEDVYILKDEYRKKYFNGKNLFLMIEKGNILFSSRVDDILDIIKGEKFLNYDIIPIIEREKNNNLGIVIFNLKKSPLGGFNECALVGNIDDNIKFQVQLGGENSIIESFNAIEDDGLDGERVLEKNKLYLRTSRENQLKTFLFFINYFFRNSSMEKIASNVYINNNTNLDMISTDKSETILDKKQFLYGDIDIKIEDINYGDMKIKGMAEPNALKIDFSVKNETIIKLLEKAQVGGKND